MGSFLAAHWIDMLSTVLGLAYIILEYKASIALWIVGMVMPALDVYLYWSVGLYADAGMAVYYTLAAMYGYAAWKLGERKSGDGVTEAPITRMGRKRCLRALAAFLAIWAAAYCVLKGCTDSSVPVSDSFVNALSVIGLWALARKHLEQWLVWMVVDAFCSALYAYKGIPFKAGLYALYVVIAVFGYLRWRRMMAPGEGGGRLP